MNLPCVTVVIKLDIDGTSATALREVEGGHEKVSFSLPAVIGAQRNLNEPRYRSLKGIMQAKKKSIEVKPATPGEGNFEIEKLYYPPAKDAGKLFHNGADAVPEVVRLLREEAKVI